MISINVTEIDQNTLDVVELVNIVSWFLELLLCILKVLHSLFVCLKILSLGVLEQVWSIISHLARVLSVNKLAKEKVLNVLFDIVILSHCDNSFFAINGSDLVFIVFCTEACESSDSLTCDGWLFSLNCDLLEIGSEIVCPEIEGISQKANNQNGNSNNTINKEQEELLDFVKNRAIFHYNLELRGQAFNVCKWNHHNTTKCEHWVDDNNKSWVLHDHHKSIHLRSWLHKNSLWHKWQNNKVKWCHA